MTLSRRRIADSVSLKAMAHPLRLTLLELLVNDGPKTATQAAALVGDSPSNCSWHLRKLAEYGFVREVPGGRGRSRPWRVVREGLVWGEDDEQGQSSAAADGVADLQLERELQRYRAARSQRKLESERWREGTGLNQSQLWLTADEAREFMESIVELFASKSGRRDDATRRPDGARLVSMVCWLVPHGPVSRPD
jgi:DNA-binding transcriptional ArsR family regulator